MIPYLIPQFSVSTLGSAVSGGRRSSQRVLRRRWGRPQRLLIWGTRGGLVISATDTRWPRWQPYRQCWQLLRVKLWAIRPGICRDSFEVLASLAALARCLKMAVMHLGCVRRTKFFFQDGQIFVQRRGGEKTGGGGTLYVMTTSPL